MRPNLYSTLKGTYLTIIPPQDYGGILTFCVGNSGLGSRQKKNDDGILTQKIEMTMESSHKSSVQFKSRLL